MEENLFITSYNEISKMHAVLSDEGEVAFLYLHAPSDNPSQTGELLATVIAYNRVEPIDIKDVQSYRPAPPPIAQGYGSEMAVIKIPNEIEWSFMWSDNGDSVLLYKNELPWCLVNECDKKGYSKAIKMSGPWGEPWDDKLIEEIG